MQSLQGGRLTPFPLSYLIFVKKGEIELQTAKISYDKKTNKITIEANHSDFLPGYLFYLLEYLGIPNCDPIYFLDGRYAIVQDEREGYIWM